MKYLFAVLLCCLSAIAADNSFPLLDGDESILLVKLKQGRADEATAFHRLHGGKVTRFKHIDWQAVELPKANRHNIVARYRNSPLFARVQFGRTYHAIEIPNDPLYSQQWAWPKIEAPAAWDIATTNNVIVAVIDTGVDFNHPDLQANLWTGPQGEHGYTAIGGVLTNGGRDDHYHGTHVAGTIGAMTDNRLGVAGINWRTKIISFKFLTAGGNGSTLDAILCIEKMVDLRLAGHNIRVSNNSWGGFGLDEALEDAFRAAENAGIINVCAAGNSALDIDEFPFSPAALSLEGLVSVLASNDKDEQTYFSNYGVVGTDIFAPGQNILSCKLGGDYWALSGTSMASPHVAGAMVMVMALNPALTPHQAKTILLHPDSYDRINYAINSTGGGRLNLRKLWTNPAIQNPPPPNFPPTLTRNPNTNLVFVNAGQTVSISVTATDPEGADITYSMSWDTYKLPFFLRYMMGGARPYAVTNFKGSGVTNFVAVTGKSLGLDQNVKIRFNASDGYGGGAAARVNAFTFRDDSKVLNLSAAIRGFRIWDDATGHPWFRLDVDPAYPALSTVRFDLRVNGSTDGMSGGGVGVPCCHPPNEDIRGYYDGFSRGSFSVRAWVADGYGNTANSPASVYQVSNSTLRPPAISINVATNRGVAPFRATADLSGTTRGSVRNLAFTVVPLNESGFTFDVFNPLRTFTLTEPGNYTIVFTAYDWDGVPVSDSVVETFTVLPAWPARLVVTLLANGLRLAWEGGGRLQEASNVTGPWTDSVSQANPQIRMPINKQFFRLK